MKDKNRNKDSILSKYKTSILQFKFFKNKFTCNEIVKTFTVNHFEVTMHNTIHIG